MALLCLGSTFKPEGVCARQFSDIQVGHCCLRRWGKFFETKFYGFHINLQVIQLFSTNFPNLLFPYLTYISTKYSFPMMPTASSLPGNYWKAPSPDVPTTQIHSDSYVLTSPVAPRVASQTTGTCDSPMAPQRANPMSTLLRKKF